MLSFIRIVFSSMALPNPFRRHDSRTRSCWGYTFQLTDEHSTPEMANVLKYSYDKLGEEAFERLNAISLEDCTKKAAMRQSATNLPKESDRRDLFVMLKKHADTDEVLGRLWQEVNTVPAWVDWEQISRGQEVFYRYGGPALTGLCFQSLLGGMVG